MSGSQIHRNLIVCNILRAACVLVLLCLLAACGGADKTQLLRVGTNIWPGYEPLYLARSLGYLDELPVRLVEYPSASEVIRAFRNGAIEGAALTLDEVLLLEQNGLEPRVVLVMDISDGGDVILGREGMQGIEDIRGKRVGVEDTALGAYVLTRALGMHHMTMQDIEVVPLEVAAHRRAFVDGEVDAVVTFDPVRSRLLAVGASLLFDSSQIPNEIVDVLVVRQDYLQGNPGVVHELIERWFDSLAYQKREPDDAARVISARMGISQEEYLASLEGLVIPGIDRNSELLHGADAVLLRSAEQLARVMYQKGLLRRLPDVKPVIQGQALVNSR